MSSFVIAKEEYIKVAGVIAGIAESYSHGPRSFWVYDYKNHRNSDAESYHEKFSEFYRMNAVSVSEQYGDKFTKYDPNEYRETFKKYFALGLQAMFRDQVKKIVRELRAFFNSALYQTEREDYADEMQKYFYHVVDQLLEVAYPGETSSWGSLDLDEIA